MKAECKKIPARLVGEETVVEEGQPHLQHELRIRVPSTHYFALLRLLASAEIVRLHEQ